MRQQTYDALKQIAADIGGDLDILLGFFDETSWDKSDKAHVESIRLCLYYLHCPDKLTQAEYERAKEIYKHIDQRSKIKIS